MTQREPTHVPRRRVRRIASAFLPTGTRLLHEWTLLVFMVVLFGGVGVLLWQVSVTSSTFAEAAALRDAVRTSEALESFRALYTSEVVDRVRSHGINVTHDYQTRERSIPLPATLTIMLGDLIGQEHTGSMGRLYSDHPFPWREDGGPQDGFEAEALAELRRNPDRPFVRIEEYEGRRSLRYATADRMQASCVACHNSHPDSPKTDWKVGDVRGVLEVVRPLDGFVAQTNAQLRSRFILFMTFAAFGFAGMVFFVVRVRREVQALREMEPGSMALVYEEGDSELGASVSQGKFLLLGVVLAAAVLALDFSIPLGVAAGVPYILLVLLSLRSNRELHVVIAASVGTALTILGFMFSPVGGELWIALANRFLAIFAVWVTAILCLWQQRRASEQAHLVAEKTAAQNESSLIKETMAKLEESEARTRAIVDSAADGIITIDKNGTVESFNAAAEGIFGYSGDEVIGNNIKMLMPSPYREEHDGYLQRYFATGVKRIMGICCEVVGRRKDGSTFPMDLSVSEMHLGAGSKFTGIVRDITNQKQAEKEIERHGRFLSTVIESLPHPFIVINVEDFTVLTANRAARDNAPPGARTCHAMTHFRDTPCDCADHPCPLTEVVRTGKPFMIEHMHTNADGSPMPVEVHAFPVFDENGRVVHLIEYSLDITERRQAETDLEVLNERLVESSRHAGMAEIAIGVLHNVGNVLNSVNVSASIVSEKLRKSKVSGLVKASDLMSEHAQNLGVFMTEDEKGKKLPGYLAALAEYLVEEQASILGEVDELSKNIDHIKKIVSAQQSHASVCGVVESVSIAHIVDDAITISAASAERYGIEMVREYADLPPVVLDKQKLLQIIVNLIRNAKHAVLHNDSETKRLTLRVAVCEGDRVRIEVTDTGVGIPKENMILIFTHGFTTKKDGYGFGLHSAALAAKEMGGSLSAQSDGPGQGATFTLDFPFEPAEVRVST